MRSLRFLLALLTATAAARAAAPVITNIANFPSVSVSYTNYLAEGVVTNGLTLGGVRKTAWSWTDAQSGYLQPINQTGKLMVQQPIVVGTNTPTLYPSFSSGDVFAAYQTNGQTGPQISLGRIIDASQKGTATLLATSGGTLTLQSTSTNFDSSRIQLAVTPGVASLLMRDVTSNRTLVDFEPFTTAAGNLLTNYLFDTHFGETNPATVLVQVRNGKTNLVAVRPDGTLTISGRTNRIGDNGTTLTYNGTAIGGSSGISGTVIASGTPSVGDLLSASDVTGTNGVWVAKPNWVNSGTSNSVLSGVASLYGAKIGDPTLRTNTAWDRGWSTISASELINVRSYLTNGPTNGSSFFDVGQMGIFYVNPTDSFSGYANYAGGLIQLIAQDGATAPANVLYGQLSAAYHNGTNSAVHVIGLNGSASSVSNTNYSSALSGVLADAGNNEVGQQAYHAYIGNHGAWAMYAPDGGLFVYGTTNLPVAGGVYIGSSEVDSGGIDTLYGLQIADQTSGQTNYAIHTGVGRVRFGDVATAIGIGSVATDAAATITSGGWTNSFGKNAVVRFDGTAITYVVYNNAGTAQYTNSTAVGHATELLQPNGKILITAGSGVSGTASPF